MSICSKWIKLGERMGVGGERSDGVVRSLSPVDHRLGDKKYDLLCLSLLRDEYRFCVALRNPLTLIHRQPTEVDKQSRAGGHSG